MKKVVLFALVAFGLLAVSCNNQPKENAEKEMEAILNEAVAAMDSTVNAAIDSAAAVATENVAE